MDQINQLLDRFLDPIGRAMSPDVARRIVDLRADAEAQSLMEDMADRSTEGVLTMDERAEYEALVTVNGLIAMLQSKARVALASNPAA